MKHNPRAVAASLIAEALAGHSLKERFAEKSQRLSESQRPLCRELVYGTLREWPRLDALLTELLTKPLRAKDRDVLALMGIGIYQLEQMRLPSHAAVSETVNAVQGLGKGWAKGLTNGVLRNYQRQQSALEATLAPSARAALPAWLFKQLQREWPESLEVIGTAARTRPPMHLRVNSKQTERDPLLAQLAQNGIEARSHPRVDSAIVLASGIDVSQLPGFSAGAVSVQDASAQLAAPLLRPAPGERILDACAAPGGKSCHIAELQPDLERLIAADISADRLERVRENRDRLGLNFELMESDLRNPVTPLQPAQFDAILVDAPCSASGVLRRNPDIKVIRQPEDIARFATLQREILSGVWPLLKPGGRLLYATCSILSAENDEVIQWAASALPGATIKPLKHPQAEPTRYGIQCLPSLDEGDGLYYGLLEKHA
ncbi:MAG: 16S rRNA (cytosine(967)-C(5))-methyltransferase RsmB [Halieaceae bacterium]|nr:16S rRNA (cytosine(967)-C(5))-methyltransferase RsmB [Halieaceae bacterium]